MNIAINTSQLETTDLRKIIPIKLGDYTVVEADIVDPDDYDDVWRAVVEMRDGSFYEVFFTYNKTGDEFPQHIFSAFSSRPPKRVFPVTVYR
jgi:hypothetical protein